MFWITASLAAEWTIPVDFPTLRDAFDSTTVVSGDVLLLGPGIWPASVTDADLINGKSLTLRGAGMDSTTILGLGTVVLRVRNLSTLTVEDLTIDGEFLYRGVGVEEGSTALLNRVRIQNADAGGMPGGGAMDLSSGSTMVAIDSEFLNNTGTDGGGARVFTGSSFTATNSLFSQNSTIGRGGAIYLSSGSNLDLVGCSFDQNSGERGGALFLRGSAVIVGSSFTSNQAGRKGGAIRTDNASTAIIDQCSFLDNDGGTEGGALAGKGTLSLSRLRIERNRADLGGAISIQDGSWAADNLYLCGNTATTDSVLSLNGGTSSFDNMLFVLNSGQVASADLAAPDASIWNSTFWADGSNPIVQLAGGSLQDSIVGDVVGAGQTGVFATWAGGTGAGNLIFNVVQVGISAGFVADPGMQIDTTDCATAFYATPTSNIFDVGSRVDQDGSISDIGHLGGPLVDIAFWEADVDGDGFIRTVDCDDADPSINPAAIDICDGIDTDCDGTIEVISPYYLDADGDGFGDPTDFVDDCSAPLGRVASSSDCDDQDPSINPGSMEQCNGFDDDCDGDVDQADSDVVLDLYFADTDADGFGDPSISQGFCIPDPGWVAESSDCDDTEFSTNPSAAEACIDGVDNDCDGLIDTDDPDYIDTGIEYWFDGDLDGVGTPALTLIACSGQQPLQYVPASLGEDCDDGDPLASPGLIEECDGIDNDCNGTVDEGFVSSPYWPDADLDGFGDTNASAQIACTPIAGFVNNADDCDDTDSAISPVAAEVCDQIDQDCDGTADDGLPTSEWFPDADGDGYGDLDADPVESCDIVEGRVQDNADCDDTNASVNPAAVEVPDDGSDNDCVGGDEVTIPVDSDGDGIPDSIDPDPNSTGDVTGSAPDPDFGCGCASTSSTGGTLGFVALAGLLLRRRKSQR